MLPLKLPFSLASSISYRPPNALVQTALIQLLNYERQGLRTLLEGWQEPPYRGDQLFRAIHQQGLSDIHAITTISKATREKLCQTCIIAPPSIQTEQRAKDGTCKWILALEDGNRIETVFIPSPKRGTLCISSQVGCALNCQFCSTGQQGFNRNLTTAEIIGQLWRAKERLQHLYPTRNRLITNVVFMGMGEPLLNLKSVVAATHVMLDDHAYGLSKRRVTVSTSGIVPAMQALKEQTQTALAISLHAPNDTLRDQLVPINCKYPLKSLIEACKQYVKGTHGCTITFEYVMLDRINDQLEQAKELARLIAPISCKVNLIPFNPFPNTTYRCSTPEAIESFQNYLMRKKIYATVRKTRGDDIDAACGQLVGRVQNRQGKPPTRMKRTMHWSKTRSGSLSAKNPLQ